jgi:hypothetical protein
MSAMPARGGDTPRLSAAARLTAKSVSGDLRLVIQRLGRSARDERHAYHQPSRREALGLASAFRAVLEGDLGQAIRFARPVGYRVLRFTDVPTGRHLIMLTERTSLFGSSRGWGLYVHSPDASGALTVEVAHPTDDLYTNQLGLELFRAADATDLFVAGATRDSGDGSADVAHSPGTAFEAVHQVALQTGNPVIQPHGFDRSNHSKAYGQAVVSSGEATPSALATRLADSMRDANFSICLFDGVNCRDLGGTTNVQGRSANAAGVSFLHVEMALSLREDPSYRKRVVAAIASALAPSVSLP